MSFAERFRPFAAVYILLLRDNEIFLLRRFQTGWQDGSYGLPSGHLEGEETIAGAARREAKEEIGVEIAEKDLRFAHVMHRIRKGDREYVDFYFETKDWQGEPHNAEENKCDEARWFPLDKLPQNIIPSVRTAIENSREGILFSEYGWEGQI